MKRLRGYLRLGHRAVVMFSVLASVSGCAVLYSETRDKQGKELKDAYAKVDLKNQIEIPRKNRAAILEQQLLAIDALGRVQRDAIIRAVATGTAPGDTVLARLNMVSRLSGADTVLGSPAADPASSALAPRTARIKSYTPWLTTMKSVDERRRYISNTVVPQFALFSLNAPTCDDLAKNTEVKKLLDRWVDEHEPLPAAASADSPPAGPVRAVLRVMDTQCKQLEGHLQSLEKMGLGGELGAVVKRLDKERNALEGLRARTAALRAEVEAVIIERDKAEKQGQGERVRKAAEKLADLLPKLMKAEDVFSVQFLADKEQDALNAFLATIRNTPAGEQPPAESSRAAMALVLLPDLFDETKAQLAEANKASLMPLILQKDLSKIKYDAASREIATRELRVALLQQQEALLREQVASFIDLDMLVAEKLSPSLLGQPMVEVLTPPELPGAPSRPARAKATTSEQRADVWKAVALYVDTGVRKGGEFKKIALRLNALDDEILLGYSEANVAQWNTLVGANVDQLAAFGAAGIRPEQIGAFINSLSLLWIGAGVNK
ncbi:MAG TPA: hypothetical protein VIM12_14445 [Noviherbaspirillum sp.]|jgi:hypothetical protein|uniref:hypothetical protein n=1 Tax=Noviherbaspirillum sp. TaxID=1926288 RepID=UPI002F943526